MADIAELVRAYYMRALGYYPSSKSLGLDPPGVVLVSGGLIVAIAEAWGRNKHGVQVAGLITGGGGIQMQSSIDGLNFVNLGSQINANGLVQLTDGLYGYLKALPVGGAGSTTLAADAHAEDTEVQVAAVAGLPASGWITLDAAGTPMVIHYTGLDAGTPKKLTGIPATGPGAITGTVTSGKTVTLGIGDLTTVTLVSAIVA